MCTALDHMDDGTGRGAGSLWLRVEGLRGQAAGGGHCSSSVGEEDGFHYGPGVRHVVENTRLLSDGGPWSR